MIDDSLKDDLLRDWARDLKRREEAMLEWINEFLSGYDLDEEEGEEAFDLLAENLLQRFPELIEE